MAYTIFDETMVDMNWKEVEKAGLENRTILLPVSVIEEHGPHMDLAPDIYLAHKQAKNCKKELETLGLKSLIAPPFYWGINRCTGSFPGSFSVREETMVMLLTDIVYSLKKWGFSNIYLLNCHGDYFHITTIIKAVQHIRKELKVNAKLVFDFDEMDIYGMDSKDKALLLYRCEGTENELEEYSFSDWADIHAGGGETSCMLKDFPESVNKEILSTLTDSRVGYDQLNQWCDENGRKITPLGYCGNPQNINIKEIEKWDLLVSQAIAREIQKNLIR